MDRKDLVNKVLRAARTSVDIEYKHSNESCGIYSTDDFMNYWDDKIETEEKKSMESHCTECEFCKSGLEEAKSIAEQTDAIAGTISDEALIEAGRRYREEARTERLWAAAVERPGRQGEALGIAIAGEGKAATIIECNAWVANTLEARGTLELWGIQVIETPNGLKTDRPLDSLEEKLMGLFRTVPLLRGFNLDRRYVNVDLKERRLKEAWSLSLAIVMSIINAIYQRKDDLLTVYSADVRQDGKLEKVGYVEHKVRAAKDKGVRRFILSSENRQDVPLSLLSAPDVEILFFDHLDELVRYFELSPIHRLECTPRETDRPSVPEKSVQPKVPPQENEVEWGSLAQKAKASGVQPDFIDRFFPFLEDLCQRKPILGSLGCSFIIGDVDRVCRILPSSGLEPGHRKSIFEMGNRLFPLLDILHSHHLALALGYDGVFHSICRTSIDFSGNENLSPLHEGLQRKWATVSLLTESILFWVSPADRSVQMFDNGELIGKYLNGRWRETRYDAFKEVLIQGAQAVGISPHSAMKAACSALAVAEEGLGGMVVLGLDAAQYAALWESPLEVRAGLTFHPIPIDDLTSEEMTHFAKVGGAVLIDRMERMIAFGAFLYPTSWPSSRRSISLETRHAIARQFSEESGCLILVASRYGTVTLFDRGQELICV